MRHFGLNCGRYISIVLFCLVIEFVRASPSPSKRTCDNSKPECLRKTLQKALPNFMKGIPELGVEVLDPFYIDKLEMMLAGGLKIQFLDGHSKGLRKCVVEKARVAHDVIETQFLCNLTIKGKYKSIGRLLMFPINGDGDAAIRCKNLRITQILKMRSVKGFGDTHLEIVNAQTNHSYDGQIQYNLTNLIKGSPETSKILLDFMNQNWHLVAQEFGDPLIDFGVKIILRNVKKLLSKVPMKQLFQTWEPVPPT
ncbi:hypothetical protein ABMA28_002610 [Loxostege sticticalis]|uniref:Uncharacterized protein n=2 Tax=Loxostege sticticalis TaxID=481309 RepID=A0ABD0SXG8_LOXSC